MAQAKKSEGKSTEQEHYEGKPLSPAEDPSFHVEEWPEAYDMPVPENETDAQRQAREDLTAQRDERRQAADEARQAAEQQRQEAAQAAQQPAPAPAAPKSS
jgi:hypothetical protein